MASTLLLVLIVSCFQVSVASFDCTDCTATLCETIPVDVNLPISDRENYTFDGWSRIINKAQKSIDIAQFYFTLTDGKNWPVEYDGYMGVDIFQSLIAANQERGVNIRIVQSEPSSDMPDTDTAILASMGVATVRNISWASLVGGGILHTKLFIVDDIHVYVGSANTDWRSLSQVKELGIVVENCSKVTEDIKKVFEMYWDAANDTQLPAHWPSNYDTNYNVQTPMSILLNGQNTSLFVASSPNQFCTPHRTPDINALVTAISNAQESISIEVMDYSASSLYNNPNYYWPIISDALKAAAFNRNVQVRMLISKWPYSVNMTWQFLQDLNSIDNIQVRFFIIPDMSNGLPPPPYSRVNHAKFMVTDNHVYIGTSNWSADYYTNTGGLSWNIQHNSALINSAQAIFDRDWNSPYTVPLSCSDEIY